MKWFRVVEVYMDGPVAMFEDLVVGTEVQPLGWLWGDGTLWAVLVWNRRAVTYPALMLEAVE